MMRRYRRIVVDEDGAARRDVVDWLAVLIAIGLGVSICVLVAGVVGVGMFIFEHVRR